MTKEELEKEAEEWLDDERKYIIEDDEGFLINIAKKVKEAYLAGAEPREKRITELEKENERLTVSYETLKLHNEEEIGMLKSENAELTETINKLREQLSLRYNLEDKIKELKADNDARKFAMTMSEKVEKQLRKEIEGLKKTVEQYRNEREFFIGEVEKND